MKKYILFFLTIFCVEFTFAQYYYIPHTTNPGNPGSLNTDPEYPVGSGLAAGWNTILGPATTGAAWSSTETIPFSFDFNGNTVLTYKVSSSGVLTFDVGAVTVPSYNSNSSIPDPNLPDNSVMVWGIEGSGANDNIVTKTFGNTGSQQHWIMFSSYTFGSVWTYWSIVLEEGTNNIYIVDQRSSGNVAITAGIQIDANTAFSVSGSPFLSHLCGGASDDSDNYYYEFIFGSQPDNEAELTSLDITEFSVSPATIDIQGTVTNLGGNNITSMDITWTDGTNSYTDNLTGLNIATFATYYFTHSDQLNLPNPSSANISITINSNVNGNIDPDTTNNTLSMIANAVTYIPEKRVVFEEATGTWCGWCPRGAVGLEELATTYPDRSIGIAVHNNDPMVNNTYDAGLSTLFSGYPSGVVDRVILDIDPGDFLQYYTDRINVISPVDISATADFDTSNRQIDINISAEFVAELSGDYRFNAVILEDHVGPYSQENYYSFQAQNQPLVSPSGFDWQAATHPVSVTFDHVARDILGGFEGTPSSLPTNIPVGTTHTFNYNHSLPASQNEHNVHVVGMIINNTSGEILNAIKVNLSGIGNIASWDCNGIGDCEDPGTGNGQYSTLTECQDSCNLTSVNENLLNILIHPNPVENVLIIQGEYSSITIHDMYGKIVYSSNAKNMIDISRLNNGIYFLNIKNQKNNIIKKITKIQ